MYMELCLTTTSPFGAFLFPNVLVRKPGQTLRFCVDFRRLNAQTRAPVSPMEVSSVPPTAGINQGWIRETNKAAGILPCQTLFKLYIDTLELEGLLDTGSRTL